MTIKVLFIFICTIFQICHSSYNPIYVGGIFDDYNENKALAFRLAIESVNKNNILKYHYLVPVIEHFHPEDSNADDFTTQTSWTSKSINPFEAIQTACRLLAQGVVGIFDSLLIENSHGVKYVCDSKEVPFIESKWDTEQEHGNCMLNLYPYPPVIAKIYSDIVKKWEWKNFTILYEDEAGLPRISELLKMYNNTEYTVVVRQLDKHNTGNYRPTLKEVWQSGQTHFVLDCSIGKLEEVLRQAQQIGLMADEHSYIITNFDMHTVNLTPFQYSETNITGVRFIDPLNERIVDLAEKIQQKRVEIGLPVEDQFGAIAAWHLRLETALIFDAVVLFASALAELETFTNFDVKPVFCNSSDSWEHGHSVINYMKTQTLPGLSGIIKFDHQEFRSDFEVDIIELKEGGITEIGTWNPTDGVNVSRTFPHVIPTEDGILRNKSFRVSICLTEPYGIRAKSSELLTGNDRFEGFAIDLIDALAELEGFTYTFYERVDKNNGDIDQTTGRWTGMLGDIVDDVVDLAIADLTITAKRESVVDFTERFMSLGIQILYRKPSKEPPSFFSFAQPFALEVWGLIVVSYFSVSLSLFVMARLCPAEWNNPYPCVEEPKYLINQFSLRNSMWFTLGGFMQQGSDLAPIGFATRLVAGVWWLFTLIMVSSYTANLAVFLSKEVGIPKFNDAKELVDNAERLGITYGSKAGGATYDFFRLYDGPRAEFKEIFKYMQAHEEAMPKENKEGVEWVMDETKNYAFFMESLSIEYETQRKCNLTAVGEELDEKGYGIAMKKGSPYRNALTNGILKLRETGVIDEIERKWWREKNNGGQCTLESSDEVPPLSLKNVEGIFWVTIYGTTLAFLLVFVEMAISIGKKRIRGQVSFRQEFKEELKFYIKFKGMVKPVRDRKSESPCSNHSDKIGHYGFALPEILT